MELTTGISVVSCWIAVVPAKLGKGGEATRGSWTVGEDNTGCSCLVSSAATHWTNCSNRAAGNAGIAAGVTGSAIGTLGAGSTGLAAGTGGVGSLACAAGCLLPDSDATRDSKAWLDGQLDPVDRQGGIWKTKPKKQGTETSSQRKRLHESQTTKTKWLHDKL